MHGSGKNRWTAYGKVKGTGMKKVSIIVPIYNVEEYLAKCLDSLVEQTYKNVELILINDGSTDHSLKIAEEYEEKYRQIKLVSQRNGGLSKARNTGMDLATGEYLCFVDSDDWLELDTIQEIVSLMDKDDLDLCLFGANTFLTDENDLRRYPEDDYCYSSKYKGIYQGKELFSKLYCSEEFKASACMYMVRRKLITEKGLEFKEGMIHEDELFTPYLFYYAGRSEITERKFYNRRIRKNSIVTGTKALEHMKGYGSVFLGLSECPGNEDENQTVAASYLQLCIDNFQQSLNYYVLLTRQERRKVKALVEEMRKEKKRKKFSLPFIYYIFLLKEYMTKRGKKQCI